MKGLNWCRFSFVGLVLLALYWFGWSAPTPRDAAVSLSWAAAPWVPLAAAAIFRLPGLWVYGGIGALLCFCHGVMEAWVAPEVRALALIEVLLSLTYFIGLHLRTRQLRTEKAARLARQRNAAVDASAP